MSSARDEAVLDIRGMSAQHGPKWNVDAESSCIAGIKRAEKGDQNE